MVHMGESGYTASCREIVGAAKRIALGIRKDFPELYILGDPLVSVVAFGSQSLAVYEVGDRMSKAGWHCAFFFRLFWGGMGKLMSGDGSERAAEPSGVAYRLYKVDGARR